jgi:hypothetical protein
MGLIGAYMGWQIRLGNGEDVTPLTLGETIRVAHPKIIGGAFVFFFLLGGQGGLVLLDAQDKSILESPHAMTAVLSVVLLTAHALSTKAVCNGEWCTSEECTCLSWNGNDGGIVCTHGDRSEPRPFILDGVRAKLVWVFLHTLPIIMTQYNNRDEILIVFFWSLL